MSMFKKYRLCIVAGFYSCIGSLFCKVPTFFKHNAFLSFQNHDLVGSILAYILFYLIPWLLMILCNLCSWRYVLKASQYWEQTLPITVLTTASNFIISFLVSTLIFNENCTFKSWLGVTCLLIGIKLLCEEGEFRSTDRFKNN